MSLMESVRQLGSGLLAYVLLSSLLLILLYFINKSISVPYPKGIALLREAPGATRFRLRTRLAYYTDCASLFREAWQNVSPISIPGECMPSLRCPCLIISSRVQYAKKGTPVMIPGLGARAEIILPQSSLPWVMSQRDDVLSIEEAFAEIDGAYYALGTHLPVSDGWQGLLVKKDMNSVLGRLAVVVNEEVGLSLDEALGFDTEEWKEIDLAATMSRVIAQATSRFTVGLPLCRNEAYLSANWEMINALILNAGIVSGAPVVLQPALGRLSGISCKKALRKIQRSFKPLYLERLETVRLKNGGHVQQEPLDLLQMMLQYAKSERPHELHDFDLISKRLVASNFGSINQTTLAATNLLLDIIGSDTDFNTIATLREEICHVLGSDPGQSACWTKTNVAKLVKADSVVRETLRLHAFGGRAVFRKVLVDGLVTDGGVELPKGSLITFLSQPISHDEDFFENATIYDPFRFSRIRDAAMEKRGDSKNGTGSLSLVSTGSEYLVFGHGRHSCPGRFMVDLELKMVIAHVLTNYDLAFPVSYGTRRPENRWVAEAYFPPKDAKIQVRRRKGSS